VTPASNWPPIRTAPRSSSPGTACSYAPTALAAAIAEETGEPGPSPTVRAIAHLVVNLPALLRRDGVDAREQLDATFVLLRDGWNVHQ
jgi:hypothetical protein